MKARAKIIIISAIILLAVVPAGCFLVRLADAQDGMIGERNLTESERKEIEIFLDDFYLGGSQKNEYGIAIGYKIDRMLFAEKFLSIPWDNLYAVSCDVTYENTRLAEWFYLKKSDKTFSICIHSHEGSL